MAGDGRDGREEISRVLDGQVQHLCDGLAFVVDLQGLPVVPRAVAFRTRHVDVGQEVHLDPQSPVARARLTPATLDIEREPAGGVAADLCLLGLGEQAPDVIEDAGVGRRVRAWCPPDGALVDMHDLVEVVHTGHRAMPAGYAPRGVQFPGQDGVEHIVDQGRLAGPGHTRDRHQDTQREVNGDVAQIVFPGVVHRQLASRVDRTADGRHLDAASSGQVGPGDGVLALEQLLQRARHDDLTTVLAGCRADVHDPVRGSDRVLVVLHHDQRVAEIPKADQRLDQPVIVALVQADAGFVQDVQHSHQSAADLGGQANALRLSPGQGAGRPVQGQIVQPDVDQEPQSGVHLLENPFGDLRLPVVEFHIVQECGALGDRQRRDLGDVAATDRHRQAQRLKAGALAGRTWRVSHIAREAFPHRVGLRGSVTTLDERDHTLPPSGVGPLASIPVPIADNDLLAATVQQHVLNVSREVDIRRIHREMQFLGQSGHQPLEVLR